MSALFQYSPLATSLAIGFAVSLLATYIYAKTARPKLPLPPGPKPWPIVGNINDLPPPGAREWEFWGAHREKYGPISSVTMLGTTLVVINSSEIAFELLEKRSAIYSARPNLAFAMDLCGWENSMSGQTQPARLRDYRKRVFEVMGSKAKIAKFSELQDSEVSKFLVRTLENPTDLVEHIRTEMGAVILKLTYGYTIDTTKRDPLVDVAEKALDQFSRAIIPGAWLVDVLPILRYLPEWMPGADFKKTARLWKATLMEMAERPMQFVRKQMADNRHPPSYVSTLYEKVRAEGTVTQDDEDLIKWTAASMYAAGADTSVGVMAIFFLGMILHPAVQEKAHQEIDRVVGRDRLPTIEDREHLPYLEAVFKEAFRWHTLAPFALPHVCSKDDIYEGYLIPKGAIMMPNVWWFAHDPAVYPNPDVFDPTRFLGPNPAPDPTNYAFGFGRRICPGKILAETSVWLTIARSLAVFTFSKFRDEQGNVVEPEAKFVPGTISHPLPYKVTVRPRSAEHERLVRQLKKLHPQETSSADELESVAF